MRDAGTDQRRQRGSLTRITRGYSLPNAPSPTFDRTPERAIHPDRMTGDPHPDGVQRKEHAAGRVANPPSVQRSARATKAQRIIRING
jgi:hypothetical protein